MNTPKDKSPRINQFTKSTVILKTSNLTLNKVENNDEEPKNDFYCVTRPLYFFSRLVGLMPFTLVRCSNRNILIAKVTVRDLIWFFISIAWYCVLAAFASNNLRLPQSSSEKPPGSESLTINVGDHLLLIVGLLIGSLSIIMDMFNRNKLANIAQKYDIFDNEIKKFGVHVDNKRSYKRLTVAFLLCLIVSVSSTVSAFIIYDSIRKNPSTFVKIHFFCAYTFQTVIMGATMTSFVTFMRCLHRRFDALNAILRKHFLIDDDIKHVQISLNKESSIATIKFIGKQYGVLTGIMSQINFCYSFQVMLYTGTTFVLSVLTCYSYYRYLLQQNEFFKESSNVHLNRCMFFSTYIGIVIYLGSLTRVQGKKTAELVYNIINSCYDADIVQSLGQLSHQVTYQYPVASCGLFSFDWTLSFLMIGSTATYLTILVQFEP